MVTLDKIRLDMKQRLQNDKGIQSVEVNADTLDEALADAAVQLNSKVSNLEYEIEEKGYKGFVGLAKKPWVIRVYENPILAAKNKKTKIDDLFANEEMDEETKVVDRDGMFYIRHFSSQICLKIVKPEGSGKPVDFHEVIASARRSDTVAIEENQIKKFVKEGTNGEYQPIGEYKHVGAGDALMAVDISKDEMKATITVTAPSMSGAEISSETIKRALQTQGVVAGIEDDKISEFVDNPVYNIPFEVAAAVLPINGRDAYVSYNFETDRSKLKAKEAENGQVDFKELNLIQNVIEGQPLAQKNLPERGKGGKTLFGRYLEAKDGKDIPMPLGQNVKVDSDGRTILATTNGQVLLIGDKISVEPIYDIPGNVDIKTGNINFFGTVVCHGNVEDGFDITATGNIEVYGTVGKSKLKSDGDIIIAQGVTGHDEGEISTQKSLWAKFIQNTKIDAGEYVVVNDSIINSQVTAMKKIILQGKRATILGGHLFATEEITAKNIGSTGGGSETILEVGFDPKAKLRLTDLQAMQANLIKELDEIDLNISTLENQKKIRRSLPKDKEENLAKLSERKNAITKDSNDMTKEIQEIQSHLRELKVVGKVNVSGTVYAGVKIYVRDEKDEVKNDVKGITFYYENGMVRRGKYDPNQPAESIKEPDGYSTY
ncbi:MAG: FapA family protein [Treponema sp.]